MKHLNVQSHPRCPLSTIHHPLPKRSGFSFAEVMFAVVILGIGFIMVAAIFPVAIQQTQATGEENIAAIAARDAADGMTQIPSTISNPAYTPNFTSAQAAANPACTIAAYPTFPPTVKNYVLGLSPSTPPPAIVVPFNGTRWKMLQSDTIVVSDQRYAYVPFYRRENGAGAAELIVISVAVRNKPTYVTLNDALNSQPTATVSTQTTINMLGGTPPAQNALTVVYPDTISVSGASGNALVEGSAVIAPTPAVLASFSGRTYSLGRLVGANKWEINPADGLALTAGSDGNWGTPGATVDAILTGQACWYNTSTTLQPQVAYATLASTPQNPAGQIKIFSSPTNVAVPSNVGPGAFVIIADDYPFNPAPTVPSPAYEIPGSLAGIVGGSPPFAVGSMNGRIFRLGSIVGPDSNGFVVYNLDPAYGMLPPGQYNASPDTLPNPQINSTGTYGPDNGWGAKCYIVGVGRSGSGYAGSSQDTGVFATYFPVK